MRLTVRVFVFCLSFIFLGISLFGLSSPAFAQTTPSSSNYPNSFEPNIEPGVARDQHTLAQSTLTEMILAIGCQIAGIDFSNPAAPCLEINPVTHKLGYTTPTFQDGHFRVGGVVGALNNGIATLYTPSVTTSDYTRYLSDSFGIAKQALAAPKNGFEGLSPLLSLWKASRDVSYFFLIIAFAFIGLGVMMRVRIDPRTVMTIQNQIPRVIIAIILITFSYPIAAAMTDLMWATTYMGINVITNADPVRVEGCGDNRATPLAAFATDTVLGSPFSFANRIFLVKCDFTQNGLIDLSKGVGNHLADLTTKLLMNFIGLDADATCGLTNPFGCIATWTRNWISILWALIVFVVVIITLFRIWFELLKAYALILVYVILAPLFISVNLLPKRPLGFGKWIRTYFANLALFPATVAIMLLARIFVATFDVKPENTFIPPLIGNPNLGSFGGLVGFALLLLAPQTLSLLREKLGVPPVKQVGAAMQTFNAGRQAVGGLARKPIAGLTRRNATTGIAEAPLSRLADKTKEWAGVKASNIFGGENSTVGRFFGRMAERQKNKGMKGYYMTDEEMGRSGMTGAASQLKTTVKGGAEEKRRAEAAEAKRQAAAPAPQPGAAPGAAAGAAAEPQRTAGREPLAGTGPTTGGEPQRTELSIRIASPQGAQSHIITNPGQAAHEFVIPILEAQGTPESTEVIRTIRQEVSADPNSHWRHPIGNDNVRENVQRFLDTNLRPPAEPEEA